MLSEPVLLESLVRLYPLCKRLLLNTPWASREITGTQRLALMTLEARGPMTMTSLAEAVACSKEQATRAVAPLVEQGYLLRRYDRENRTRVWVTLTEPGRTLLRQEHLAVQQELQGLLQNLSGQDADQLGAALETVSGLMARAETRE